MITGHVTPGREAVVELAIRNADGRIVLTRAVVDTGFTEHLTLPPDVIDALRLPFKNIVPIQLADGIDTDLRAHYAWVDWDGALRRILCLQASGVPWIGMGLLSGYRLVVNGVDGGLVTIRSLSA